MAINPSTLRSKSLTPTDFAKLTIGHRMQSYVDLTAISYDSSERRHRSLSDDEDESSKEMAYRKFIRHDYIVVSRLTVDAVFGYSGFSAFFLSLSAACPSLMKRLMQIKLEDEVLTKLYKATFYKGFIAKVLRCHGASLDITVRPRVEASGFSSIIPYTIDNHQRALKLTQLTLEKRTRAARLKFPYQTPEQMPENISEQEKNRFFATREALIDLREREAIVDQPRVIEYLEKFLFRVGYTKESLSGEICFHLLPKTCEATLKEDVCTLGSYLEEVYDLKVFDREIPKYFIAIRDRDWTPDLDMVYYPSVSINLENQQGERATFELKSIVFVSDTNTMNYSSLLLNPDGAGFVWSQDYLSTYGIAGMRQKIAEAEIELLEGGFSDRAIVNIGDVLDIAENIDCLIYERKR